MHRGCLWAKPAGHLQLKTRHKSEWQQLLKVKDHSRLFAIGADDLNFHIFV
jgi:hypothetical protein